MKTYTRDEIKRIMIDRPGVEVRYPSGNLIYRLDENLVLRCRDMTSPLCGWSGAESGLRAEGGYTIPADNEKPAELPKSVKGEIDRSGWLLRSKNRHIPVLTALWAETVKLVEAGKK